MEKQERIIEKIKKVLELSKNNPSQEEAQAAALKAQRLMAEYHISMKDVEAVEDVDTITEKNVHVGMGNKWKYRLANIVSKNFRCKHFLYGKDNIVFYGYEVDVEIATETFKYLFEVGNKAAASYYNKLRNQANLANEYFDGRGIKNCFLVGFTEGIKEELEKQCTALMIVTPKQVEDAYKQRSEGFKMSHHKLNTSSFYGNQSREAGRIKGRESISSRQIEVA